MARPAEAAWPQLSSAPSRHRAGHHHAFSGALYLIPDTPVEMDIDASWCNDWDNALQDPPFKRTRLLPLSPPRSRGWLLSSPISPGLLTRSQSGKLR